MDECVRPLLLNDRSTKEMMTFNTLYQTTSIEYRRDGYNSFLITGAYNNSYEYL